MEETQPSDPPPAAAAEQVASLQAQLADARSQLEHMQGVATICELTKQEAVAEVQRCCQEELSSLQAAMKETVSQYESRIAMLQSECAHWKSQSSDKVSPALRSSVRDKVVSSSVEPQSLRGEPDPEPDPEGYFSQHCDTSSLSSFSLDTPSLSRRPPPQDDTASLVSTGTLVPEAIYLPPPGHRLVLLADWESTTAQVVELQAAIARVREEKAELEKELESTTTQTAEQVSALQSQVQTSETLLQELQTSLSQSQSTVQARLAELSCSHQKVCRELARLSQENRVTTADSELGSLSPPPPSQGTHCEERLRIEIVNLKEQLETRTEESEVLEVQLSSLKTETDRIQTHNEQLQSELDACRTELSALRLALSHLQKDVRAQTSEKEKLQEQNLEQHSKLIRLQSDLDTSQAVQRDFVQLSQELQVRLERVRLAQTLEQVQRLLDGQGDPPPEP